MSTTATAPAYLMHHKRKGKWYSRETNDFTASQAEASPVSSYKVATTLLSHEDGTIDVTPVAGKPLIR